MKKPWLRRLGWLVALWAGGVLTLYLVAGRAARHHARGGNEVINICRKTSNVRTL